MSENRTKPGARRVDSFLASIEPEGKREDARKICAMMEQLIAVSLTHMIEK